MGTSRNLFEETHLGKTYDLKLLKRLYPYLKPYRYLIILSVLIVMMITLLELSLPYVIKIAIDRYIVPTRQVSESAGEPAHNPGEGYGSALGDDGKGWPDNGMDGERPGSTPVPRNRTADIRGLNFICALFVLLVMLNFGLNFIQRMVMEYTGHMIMHTLRVDIFHHMGQLSIAFFTRNPVGALVNPGY